jgi:hypothetical protein
VLLLLTPLLASVPARQREAILRIVRSPMIDRDLDFGNEFLAGPDLPQRVSGDGELRVDVYTENGEFGASLSQA